MIDLRRGDERVGDPAVDAAWRHASSDEPPAHVDDTILAAARAEVRAVAQTRSALQRQSWWTRWQPLAAAAGVAGLAFVLVQMVPREEAARVPAATPGPPAMPAASAPHDAGPAPAAELESAGSRESSVGDATQVAAESRAALAGAAPPAAAQSNSAPASPEAWARRVAELRAQGDEAAAADELSAFRRAFPDADSYLPPSLRRWAASVPGAESP